MDHDLQALSELATELAQSAGEILLGGFRTSSAAVTHTKSSSVDVVTAMDQASETMITDAITSKRPDDSILGEEGTSVTGTNNVRWVVDPLDGTVNFVYGIPAFAVSIGIEIDGRPSIGVVFNPATNELFSATTGQGAFLNGEAISVNSSPPLSRALVATGFSYEQDERQRQAQRLTTVLPLVRDIRRQGAAALDLCSVAAGFVDGYYEYPTKPWDICAGTVIAAEAGARVTGFDGRTPIDSVVAAHPALHSELRRLVND